MNNPEGSPFDELREARIQHRLEDELRLPLVELVELAHIVYDRVRAHAEPYDESKGFQPLAHKQTHSDSSPRADKVTGDYLIINFGDKRTITIHKNQDEASLIQWRIIRSAPVPDNQVERTTVLKQTDAMAHAGRKYTITAARLLVDYHGSEVRTQSDLCSTGNGFDNAETYLQATLYDLTEALRQFDPNHSEPLPPAA